MAPSESLSSVVPSGIGINPVSEGVKWHFADLQTLNTYFPSKLSSTKRLFYGKENFEGTESEWDNKDIIFVESGEHLDWDEYKINPEKELKRVNGRRVGVNIETVIPSEGSPRLSSSPQIWDVECNERIKEGTLGISTDFNCSFNDESESLVGKVIPNYILVFPIEKMNEQNDIGARFMNTAKSAMEEEKMSENEIKTLIEEQKSMFASFLDSLKSIFPQKHANSAASASDGVGESNMEKLEASTGVIAPAVPVEFLDKLTAAEQAANAEKERAEALAAKVAEFETTAAQQAEAAKAAEMQRLESLWQTSVMPKLPKGLVHEEASAAEIKKMFIESPYDFMGKYSDVMNKAEIEASAQHQNSAQGQTHQNSNVDENKEDAPVLCGSYDAMTGKYI